jgi:hypothetical protein
VIPVNRGKQKTPETADFAADSQGVDHVFLGMSVRREIDPFAPAPLPAVVSERLSQSHAPTTGKK